MGIKPVLFLLVSLMLMLNQANGSKCTSAIMAAMNDTLLSASMIINSGKGINDLGDVDACEATEGLHYGNFRLVSSYGIFYLGVCVPVECTKSDMKVVSQALISIGGGSVYDAEFKIPKDIKVDINGWRILGFIFFFALAALCLLGTIVEYTTMFDRYSSRNKEPPKDPAHKKTILGKAIISFSPTRNIYKLFYSEFDDKDNLRVLNGVRVLSMLYVIFGHAYFNTLQYPLTNPTYVLEVVQPAWFQIIPGGFYAVDVFFYLSAFLGAYLMLLKFEKSRRVPFVMVYFHRYYRLAPTVFLLIMFVLTFYELLGSGPIWHDGTYKWIGECSEYWWSFVLFINSFVIKDRQPQCMGWLWYLSHDMMFFLILPIEIFVYLKNRKMGHMFALFLFILSSFIVFIISETQNIGSSALTSPMYAPRLYFVPWARLGAYQVGIIMGYFYYEYVKGNKPDGDRSSYGFKLFKSIEISTAVRYTCYVTGFIMIILMVFLQIPETRRIMKTPYYSQLFADIWNPFCRPIYVFGLGLILAGPLVGKGEFLQTLLGSRFWAPWAKVSFFAYMIHLLVFNFYFGQMRQSFYLQNKAVFWVFFGVMTVTMFISIALSMFLEVPLLQLERLVLFPPRKKKVEQPKEEEEASFSKGINASRNNSVISENSTFDRSDMNSDNRSDITYGAKH